MHQGRARPSRGLMLFACVRAPASLGEERDSTIEQCAVARRRGADANGATPNDDHNHLGGWTRRGAFRFAPRRCPSPTDG